MNSLIINKAASPDEAPTYRAPDFIGLTLTEALVVGNGTVEGNPTADLILVGEDGQKYVAMITGKLLEALGSACKAVREET